MKHDPGARFVILMALAWELACGGGKETEASNPVPPPPPAAACDPAPASPQITSARDAVFGVKGDGVADDTAALQKAVDAVAGTGGTLRIPSGTYLVNARLSIVVKGAMTLAMDAGAVLKAIPTSAGNYKILAVQNASNVIIKGGTLQGDFGTPSTHQGTDGEWGLGLAISGSRQVTVTGVTARDCWGDGFNLGDGSTNVLICGCTADHNRRSGLTLTDASAVTIQDSAFMNTGGTLPELGLNLEPNPGESVSSVLVTACTFTGNAGGGIGSGVALVNTGQASVTSVRFDANLLSGNGFHAINPNPRSGLEISNCSAHTVTSNTIKDNHGNGLLMRDEATGMTVTGNVITGNSGHGLWDLGNRNTVSGNAVSGNGLIP